MALSMTLPPRGGLGGHVRRVERLERLMAPGDQGAVPCQGVLGLAPEAQPVGSGSGDLAGQRLGWPPCWHYSAIAFEVELRLAFSHGGMRVRRHSLSTSETRSAQISEPEPASLF
jgi:hypothetical protein